jgi:hypothetical protein
LQGDAMVVIAAGKSLSRAGSEMADGSSWAFAESDRASPTHAAQEVAFCRRGDIVLDFDRTSRTE